MSTYAPASTDIDTTPVESVAHITRLFPSILRIGNDSLRERVAAVWIDAMRLGNDGCGWTEAQVRSLPMTLLAGRQPLLFVEHLNSCAAQCLAIAEVLTAQFGSRVTIDVDVLLCGALCADVGKLLEYEIDENGTIRQGTLGAMLRHPFTGVALCHARGLPAEVLHIVAAHSHEGDKVARSIECIIFHHADFIDFDIARHLGNAAARSGS